MRYKAFISYSHAADGKLAPSLQSALQEFTKPWYRRRAIRVFRDETGLSVTPHLWSAIEAALNDSEHSIFLASPDASQSQWVQREITWWPEHRSAENILIVLTEGEIEWNDLAGDFDWDRTTALPEVLQKAFPEEPLYVDFRSAKKQHQLTLKEPAFLSGVGDIAATLHGCPKDEHIGEDVRQHRRTLQIARALATALSVLLLSVAAALVAFCQRNLAEERRLTAEEQRQLAVGRRLIAQSNSVLIQGNSSIELAVLLVIEGLRRSTSVEGNRTLRESLAMLPKQVAQTQIGSSSASVGSFSPDGRYIIRLASQRRGQCLPRGLLLSQAFPQASVKPLPNHWLSGA